MRVVKLLACFVVIMLSTMISLAFEPVTTTVALVWPINALLLAIVLRGFSGWRDRGLALGVGCSAMTIASLLLDGSPVHAIGMPIANAVELLIAAWFLRSVALPMRGTRALGIFLVGAVGAAVSVSTILAAGVIGAAGGDMIVGAMRWFAADALGMAIVGPFALSLTLPKSIASLDHRRMLFGVAAQVAVAVVSYVVIFTMKAPALIVIAPFVMLAVLTGRQTGAVVSVAIVTIVALLGSVTGNSAVVNVFGPLAPVAFQIALACLVMTVLPIASLLEQLDIYAAELRERHAEAERISETKTKLLSFVSHEIRSPLTGVVTLAEMLRSGAFGPLSGRQLEMISGIAHSGQEIEALSRDLTDAAAIQSGDVRLATRPVEARELVEAALRSAAMRSPSPNTRFEVGDIDESLVLQADPQRLRQVLVNLLTNAAKYGGDPGHVRIEARPRGDCIRFQVEDNGPGVPPERRAELFGRYNRLGAEAGAVEGTGLGLALSHELVNLHGGTMGVDDSPLGGACFWAEIPVKAGLREAA